MVDIAILTFDYFGPVYWNSKARSTLGVRSPE